jgi:hypothetical protein
VLGENANHGQSLTPKKSRVSPEKLLDEKARKLLLEDDLEEHPFVGLRNRCDYTEIVRGFLLGATPYPEGSVRTRKKGNTLPPSATSGSTGWPGRSR